MSTMNSLEISLNGKRIETAAATLQALLLAHGYELQTAFACAINSSFVPRPQWPERALQNGDRIDIVTPITGG
ncbi:MULTISPECIES: sulfur carrier protein ThiS [Polaromonas]|uniref:Sulfur carrier protein ThiS n=1 Tax=Polaromonas aquatica TaxID=332657 RepID=A0ABW1TZB1_9BURK